MPALLGAQWPSGSTAGALPQAGDAAAALLGSSLQTGPALAAHGHGRNSSSCATLARRSRGVRVKVSTHQSGRLCACQCGVYLCMQYVVVCDE